MIYTDFQSVLRRDEEKAKYFLQTDSAAVWLNAINNSIADWIKEKNDQGLWDVVRFLSIRRGIIKKTLSREKFAELLISYCEEKFEGKTKSQLKTSMEHCKWIKDLKECNPSNYPFELKKLIDQIEAYFDEEETTINSEYSVPTVLDRLENYLRNLAVSESNIFPCSIVKVRPDYGDGIIPTISLEKYQNKSFLNQVKPSTIEAYEIISDSLSVEKLQSFLGKYDGRRNIKLYIVSTYGIANDAYSLAEKKGIGYVRVNPQKEMTNDSYVLPRAVEDYSTTLHNKEMLFGLVSMDVPMVIWNGSKAITSLADALKSDNIPIKPKYELRAPILKFEEIDATAEEITKPIVANYIQKLSQIAPQDLYIENKKLINKRENGHSYVVQVPNKIFIDFSIDPFILAERAELNYTLGDLPKGQLGRLDLLSRSIVLDRGGLSNYDRYRFTMAHEFGHGILHANLFEEQGIASFGETEITVDDELTITDEDRMWLERQANRFASTLLMPTDLVRTLYYFLFKHFVIDAKGDSIRALYYSKKQPETWDDYNNVVGGIGKILNVSLNAIQNRLLGLNLLKIGE